MFLCWLLVLNDTMLLSYCLCAVNLPQVSCLQSVWPKPSFRNCIKIIKIQGKISWEFYMPKRWRVRILVLIWWFFTILSFRQHASSLSKATNSVAHYNLIWSKLNFEQLFRGSREMKGQQEIKVFHALSLA